MTIAYLDPGAGSLMIQMVIAAALAVPFFLRTQIARLLDRVRGLRHSGVAPSADQTTGDE